MDDSHSDDEWTRLQRSRNAQDVPWVPYGQRRATSGLETEWSETEIVFVLTVPGLGFLRVRCQMNLAAPEGKLDPLAMAIRVAS